MVDAATALSTRLTEPLKSNTAELLSYGEVQKLINELPKEQADLVEDISSAHITASGIQRAADPAQRAHFGARLRRHPRRHCRRTFVHPQPDASPSMCVPASPASRAQHTTPQGDLPLIALSARWEQLFAESILGTANERSLAMQPSRLSEFITAVRERFEDAAREGEAPVLSPRHRCGRWCAESSSASAPTPA